MIFKSQKQFRKYANYFRRVKLTEVSFEKQVPIPLFSDTAELGGYLKGMEKYYDMKSWGTICLKSEYYGNRPTVPLTVSRYEIEAEFLPDGRENLEANRAQLLKKVAEIDSLLG